LEIGQIAGLIDDILPAADIVRSLVRDFETAKSEIQEYGFQSSDRNT